jgi:hypothetical protein
VHVRAAIIDTITRHLQADAPTRWSNLGYDFHDAHLVNASFVGATFSGDTSFDGATFSTPQGGGGPGDRDRR